MNLPIFLTSDFQAPKKFAQQLADLRAERDKYWEQSQAATDFFRLSGAVHQSFFQRFFTHDPYECPKLLMVKPL
jgi:hypothetical protein